MCFAAPAEFQKTFLREKTVESLSTAEKIELMDRAASRFTSQQADLMRAAKEQFLSLLGES